MTDSLRDELLEVAGVQAAEFEGDLDAPAGVKVRLEPGADAMTVGEEVRRILAAHGISSRLDADRVRATPAAGAEPPPPPGAPASVVSLPTELRAAGPQERPAGHEPPGVLVESSGEAPAVTGASLASLSVEEGRGGVTVTASARDGRSVSRRSRSSASGLEEAIVAAVAALVAPEHPPPLLLAVTESTVEGTSIVSAVLELAEGARCVGSAVMEGGRAYAIAEAVWAALASVD